MDLRDRPRLTDREARSRLRKLQASLPCIYPVRFERAALKGCWGECDMVTRKGRRTLMIRVDETLSWPADFLVLVHEYAHARNWKPDKLEYHESAEADHGPEWGLKFAEVWRRALR